MSDAGRVVVRRARDTDRDAVLALVPRLAECGTPAGRDRRDVEAADLRSVAAAFDAPREGAALLVAELDDVVVGFLHAFTMQDYYTASTIAHVSDVVVAADAAGRGVGRQLMDAAERWATEAGYPMIQLYVLPENAPARGLYERIGYRPEWLKYIKPLDAG